MRNYLCKETPGVIIDEENGTFSIPGRELEFNDTWRLEWGSKLNECLLIADRIQRDGQDIFGPLKEEKANLIREIVSHSAQDLNIAEEELDEEELDEEEPDEEEPDEEHDNNNRNEDEGQRF